MNTCIFPDTNIHLHFAPLDELDLSALAGVPLGDITVVIPRVVLRELDEKKSNHPSQRVRDRARRTLRDIEAALSGGGLLKGKIRVQLFDSYPTKEMDEYHLNAGWADDILFASAMA